jgi:hypothetical protein
VTPNIIQTAKQTVNAQVVANRTMRRRVPDISAMQQPADRVLVNESTLADDRLYEALYRV